MALIEKKKNTANNKVEDAVYPFEMYFQEAVTKVKEEITERKFQSRVGMNTSKTAHSIRLGESIKTPEGMIDPYIHKSIF